MIENAILITGAGARVGHELARRFLADGRPVVAHYRTETEHLAALRDAGAMLIRADFTDDEAVEDFMAEVRSNVGSLAGLINNASAYAPTADDRHEAAKQFARFYTIHMLTPWMLATGLADLLRAGSGEGCVVNMTDIYAARPNPLYDLYCATKAGLTSVTESLAVSLAPAIRVNAVAPGPILFLGEHTPEQRKKILGKTPLGKEGGAEPVYRAIRSILENPYMTGATVVVDGGRRLPY